MQTVNIQNDTTLIAEFPFPGNSQIINVTSVGCTRVSKFRNIHTVGSLPKYIQIAIAEAGYTAVIVGSSTYKYTLIGLIPTTKEGK